MGTQLVPYELTGLVSGMTAQRDEAMETLRASEEQAREILASVGGVGQAEQYLRQHERQRGAADRWRDAALFPRGN